ncbi:hypothetical protein GBA63_05910 [Rubrobacter tropicus]|uniref:Uncharacterized protein n=1 Tax=Rubrobacter tropicus TaxID=2653851 RepID=A0A6G8Q6X0_9ACTN|nr:hypothetical protein [Rubrobacter tropicus]QIN82234.1 hypothetical protein GBA63_05910 [Rubrobacter tropicus]
MRRSPIGYALLGGLAGIFVFNLLFPKVLDSGFLFGALVALLFVGGLVGIVVSAARMFRR